MTGTDPDQFGTRWPGEERGRTRPRGHPVRRRLRRRHAADRRPLHLRDRVLRQRPVHAAQLPRRDPGAHRHPARRVSSSSCTSPTTTSSPRATRPTCWSAMNPAALKANLADLPGGGLLIVNTDEFTPAQPGEGRLRDQPAGGRLPRGLAAGARVPLTSHDARRARRTPASARRTPSGRRTCSPSACCPGCTPGPTEATIRSWSASSPSKPELAAANIAAFRAGWNYGETTEAFAVRYEVKPAPMAPGTYRNITGNLALGLGLVAAGAALRAAGLPRRLPDHPGVATSCTSCPSTRRFGVRTFQAEDEIAGVGAALGRLVRRRAGRHHDVRARASR